MWQRLSGWRTFIFFTPAFLISLLDAMHAIDFRQILLDMGLPDGTARAVVAFCLLMGIVLRTYTTTPPLRSRDDRGGDECRS